jgi:hypothetical protein
MPHAITSERTARASDAGCGIEITELYTPAGFPSGEKQQRIIPPVELLLRGGKLDGGQYSAAQYYASLVFRMMRLMPKLTQGDIRLARSTNNMRGLEHRMHAVAIIVRIHDSFDPVWWPALAWVGVNYEHGRSALDLGQEYYPYLRKSQQHANAVEIIQAVTSKLCDHFERNSYGSKD